MPKQSKLVDKISSLDFSTANNACLSLRTLAEWVRVGEVVLDDRCNWDGKLEAPLVLGFAER